MALVRKFCSSLLSNRRLQNEIAHLTLANRSPQTMKVTCGSVRYRLLFAPLSHNAVHNYCTAVDDSSKKTKSQSMAEQILAAKVSEEKSKNQSTAEGKPDSEDSSKTDEEEKAEQVKNQVRALKFSFIAFGSIIISSLFGMIYIWGE